MNEKHNKIDGIALNVSIVSQLELQVGSLKDWLGINQNKKS
jgi:hypothetical protein